MSRRRRRRDPNVFSLFDAYEGLRSDYRMAKQTRFRERKTGVPAMGSGADYHYRNEGDYLRLIELARDLDRNNVVVGQALTRLVANVLQEGFRLDPRTGDRKIDLDLAARWRAWSESRRACDISEQRTFAEQAELALRHVIVDGDVVALATESGHLQLVEGHRVRTPRNTRRNVVHGVLLDDFRRRLEYWVAKDNVDPLRPVERVADFIRYPARDEDGNPVVFHVYDPTRASQTRGVTAFARVFDSAEMHDDIQFAKLVQQKACSAFAILRELPSDFDDDEVGADEDGRESRTELNADGSTRYIEGYAPGIEYTGRPGEELKGFSPNVPNAEFFQHVSLILTLVAVNLHMPVQMLLLDGKATNFSGWRGAFDQAKIGLRRIQRWLIGGFHRPAYEWKVREWLSQDGALRRAAMQVDIFRHRWHPPNWPYIEPLKDASADLLRLRNGLTSPSALFAERGVDWDDHIDQTIEDNVLAIRRAKLAAIALNQDEKLDDGYPVHWRECLSLPTPDGVTVAVTSSEPASWGAGEGEEKPFGEGEEREGGGGNASDRLRLAY